MTASTAPSVRFDTDADLRRLASCRRDRVRFVDVPEKRYLAIEGREPPGGREFREAIGALYGVAYPLHFALRARGVRGHRVGMLDALFWIPREELVADGPTDVGAEREWPWRLLIVAPDEATDQEVHAAIGGGGPLASRMFLDRWCEGPSAQILHVGPYHAMTPTLRRLHAAIVAAGLKPHGPHHEIYLNNPQEVGEDRARTVLRQPVMR